MKILLLGSGGREHALAWKIAASPLTTKLWCAPGNAGIAQEAECVAVDLTDHAAVVALCRKLAVDFVVVGPDNPLVAGIVDDIEAAGFRTFGPTKAAARLEGSKGFTKDLCRKYGIPTAAYERFTDAASAKAYVRAQGAPIVVKADGLALGKGVVVAQTIAEAEDAIDMMFGGAFGEVGQRSGDRGVPQRRGESPSSRCATARPRSRLPPRRITSAPSTATRDRTPAAWAPIRRCRPSATRSPARP